MKGWKMQINSKNVPDLIPVLRKEDTHAAGICSHEFTFSILFGFHTYFSLSMHVTHFMLVDESPESILIVWENTMETKRLLGFRQPLQEGVDH